MKPSPKIWFVDDLPENLATFKDNHQAHFTVELFSRPVEVWQRISNGDHPDALLVDIFFYDSVEKARYAESEVAQLIEELQQRAENLGILDRKYMEGVALIEQMRRHFEPRQPPFPIYAYTSKGPVLFKQADWHTLSRCGARVLLKSRVTAESERTQILSDMASLSCRRTKAIRVINAVAASLITLGLTLFLGRMVRGYW